MTTQTSACHGRMYILAITVLAAIALAGSVGATGNGEQMRIDVSAMMTTVADLPVDHISDAY